MDGMGSAASRWPVIAPPPTPGSASTSSATRSHRASSVRLRAGLELL